MIDTDLIIVGAGPAGLAAAKTAAHHGLQVLILDENPAAGGQIYRNIADTPDEITAILGPDYAKGQPHVQAIQHPLITHLSGTTVWQIAPDGTVAFTTNAKAAQARGKRILIATGAMERPMPLPGWTLPDVMTAGAAQILLKQSGIISDRAVLVGSGPLLYLVAVQIVRAGAPPLAVIETQTPRDFARALPRLPAAFAAFPALRKGLQMLSELRRAKVPRHTAATDIRITGVTRATGVSFRANGTSHTVACDTVLLHHGVVPNTHAARSTGVPHCWSDAQHCFHPQRDRWGRTPLPHVFIAGDGASILGAKAALLGGEIAALAIAHDLGRMSGGDRDLAARPLRARLWAERALRPFLDAAYPPFAQAVSPSDTTTICRCEEITAAEVRHMATLGCLGPNQAKSFARVGMGPCQGRICGLSVSQILGAANRRTPDETGYFRIRPPIKPVTLGELAALHSPQKDTPT